MAVRDGRHEKSHETIKRTTNGTSSLYNERRVRAVGDEGTVAWFFFLSPDRGRDPPGEGIVVIVLHLSRRQTATSM